MSSPSKTETTNSPPEWAKPLFEKSATQAEALYDSGAGGNVYQGQTVAGLGNTTQQGISNVTSAVDSLPSSTASQNYLKDYASGKYLADGNPYYKTRLNNEIADSNALVQSAFSGAGRYGSGANQSTIADNTSNMLLSGLESDYNRQQQNQLTAVNQIDAANSNLYQNQLSGAQAQISSGQIQDQNQQNQLDAAQQKFLAEDNKDWTRLGLLQSAASGSAGNYGTQQSVQSGGNNLLSAIGGIGSMATKSDVRLKTNIVPVSVKNGHTIYEFSYRGDSKRYRGVMAQEIIKTDPLAVTLGNDGFFAVYYDRLRLRMEAV